MKCEVCGTQMTKKILQGGLNWNYEEIHEYKCAECDAVVLKVA
jgi:hypothetical protein